MAALFTALLVFLRVTTVYSENCPSWLEFCKGGQHGKRVCYAIPNGDCPDAGSTTECENPSKPGPWTCAWCTCADDFGTAKVMQARYDISSGGGDKKGPNLAARLSAAKAAVPKPDSAPLMDGGGGKRGGGKGGAKAAAPAAASGAMGARMLSCVLSGIHRALPFAAEADGGCPALTPPKDALKLQPAGVARPSAAASAWSRRRTALLKRLYEVLGRW